jgi:hypothetical protein
VQLFRRRLPFCDLAVKFSGNFQDFGYNTRPVEMPCRAVKIPILILLSCALLVEAVKPVTKLQIGVKKRVEDCQLKSKQGDSLSMHYTVFQFAGIFILNLFQGKLYETGEEFDSSIPRGEPFTFILGHGQVIQGWDRGLLGFVMYGILTQTHQFLACALEKLGNSLSLQT